MSSLALQSSRAHVVIAGAGVAGLEAALALRELAGQQLRVTLLAPETEFVYRPMAVREPFWLGGARHYAIDVIADDLGLEHCCDRLESLQADERMARTASGTVIAYDALLLAVGPRRSEVFTDVITLDERRLRAQLSELSNDIEAGQVQDVAFIAPRGATWILPIYELAMMTASHASSVGAEVALTIATPEEAPLQAFGPEAGSAVRTELHRAGIRLQTGAHCHVSGPGALAFHPHSDPLRFDRILSMPLLSGPSLAGAPTVAGGFVPVDRLSQVRGLDGVYAAGDMTDLPVKHGGIAAQQADLAAEMIAARLVGGPQPAPRPLIAEAILVGTERPLHLRAELSGSSAMSGEVWNESRGLPADKLITLRLTPYFSRLDGPARSRSGESAPPASAPATSHLH